MFDSVESTQETLSRQNYLADIGLSTTLFLSLKMGKALFLEGEPGVGKTEVAKALAQALDTQLIRLQCYEGLDINQAVYEWNYPRQLLEMQAQRENGSRPHDIFSEPYLLKRPLLQAIDHAHDKPPVLLIDELDRADEEFESFLLELLSDFQITVPEIGTLRPEHQPIIIITSNRTREIHDALKRRCVYQWIDYPSREKELEIVQRKIPYLSADLAVQVVNFIQRIRQEELLKLPGVAESLDWAAALHHLNTQTIDPATVHTTLGFVLKYQDDVDKIRGAGVQRILEEI